MGIALFHLLPEAVEHIESEFKTEYWSKIPLAFLIAFSSYALILFVEKIAFESHAQIAHNDGARKHTHHNKNQFLIKGKDEREEELLMIHNKSLGRGSSESDSDDEEEFVNVAISSKGKFASFLYMKNSRISLDDKGFSIQNNSLHRASMLLSHIFNNRPMTQHLKVVENENMNFMVSLDNVAINKENSNIPTFKTKEEKSHEMIVCRVQALPPTSNLTAYLLLIALSLHGFFEGLALGIQESEGDALFLSAIILTRKWVEAFTLGISFTKAKTPKSTFIKFICIFAMFTPLGVALGMILSQLRSKLLEGIILAISSGNYIYFAANEVILEEFAITKYRYLKYILYLVGAVFVGGMKIMVELGEK
jgi:zinc transporter ZupT